MGDRETGVPAGWYAAPDPNDADVMTFWRVKAGRLSAYPKGHRWAPVPPGWSHLEAVDRPAARDQWYRNVYFAWKRAVVTAIEADPDAAAALFLATYPEPEWPTKRRRNSVSAAFQRRGPSTAQERRATQAAIAELLRDAGLSHTEIAATLGVSEPTSRRRVRFAATQPGTLTAEQRQLLRSVILILRAFADAKGKTEVVEFLDELTGNLGWASSALWPSVFSTEPANQ